MGVHSSMQTNEEQENAVHAHTEVDQSSAIDSEGEDSFLSEDSSPPQAIQETAILQDFWCHQCRKVIHADEADPECPDCHGRFVELMNSEENPPSEWDVIPTFSMTFGPNNAPRFRTIRTSSGPHRNPIVAVDLGGMDNLQGFNSIFMLLQLLQGRATANDEIENIIARILETDTSRWGPPPASAQAVEQLETITITEAHQEQGLECAVCMDAFEIETQSLKMPCAHLFHSDCLGTWLQQHNSCPVCRHELPTDDPDYEQTRITRDAERRAMRQSTSNPTTTPTPSTTRQSRFPRFRDSGSSSASSTSPQDTSATARRGRFSFSRFSRPGR
eukprot:c21082_g1_i1.p1 GENE.c21082_g1_i1~~c21082_g1_i1.p1  ORF type:complete len:331 (+),score=47.17 c21082_g1_i1:3-995(+)